MTTIAWYAQLFAELFAAPLPNRIRVACARRGHGVPA